MFSSSANGTASPAPTSALRSRYSVLRAPDAAVGDCSWPRNIGGVEATRSRSRRLSGGGGCRATDEKSSPGSAKQHNNSRYRREGGRHDGGQTRPIRPA